MRKLVLALAALLSLHGVGYAAFAIFQTYTDPRTQVNLVTDYGATCDGVANDTAAFLAFKAAWQGATPVQLNLPGFCTFTPAGTDNKFPFKGIGNLIVAGTGSASSGIKNNSATVSMQFGGQGQIQDNRNSLRTDTANAGDSCVIAKTQPAVTVSAITNNLPNPASFTASISGTTLTVTAVAAGTIAAGAYITGQDDVGQFVVIQAYGTGGTTGAGGTGTYSLGGSPLNRTSQSMATVPASFTGTVDAAGVLTVSAVADGTIAVGMFVYRASGSISFPTAIKSQLTGSAGGTGTYQLTNAPIAALGTPSSFLGNGQIRVTLNSTAGLSSGDTLYLTGIVGRNQIANRSNGLRWIKVINGTQIDLFQSDFNGSYTSGGTGGGDRTALMPIGSKVMMTGWSNQAYWSQPYGFPSNPHWFEYKTVVSTNSATHQICFDTPLAHSYKDTWPQYNTGSLFEVDPGGPATLYVLDPTWETTQIFKDITLDDVNFQITANGRSITYQNVKFTGTHCAIPTQNETHIWVNVDASTCNIETDKIVGTWSITGGSTNIIKVQSSSMDLIAVSGVTGNSWQNSPKRLTIDNTSLNFFKAGTSAYGATDEIVISNSSIATTLDYGTPIQQVNAAGREWSMAGGVITIPNAYSWTASANAGETQTRGLVPGHYVQWLGAGGGGGFAQVGRVFKVVDVTQDLDNTYIQTSDAGGFPVGAWTTNGLSVFPHPAPKLTATNVTGAYTATAFNGCPAQAPMYSCQMGFTYTGSATGTTVSTVLPILWGELDTFTFTNNVPYTGGGNLYWTLSQFGQIRVLNTDNTQSTFGTAIGVGAGMINMKLPSSCGSCTRTLTPSGATNTQVGDSLTPPSSGAVFGGFNAAPVFSANTPSDSPQVTVNLRTNQQFPP
jgi:hypothetical protein